MAEAGRQVEPAFAATEVVRVVHGGLALADDLSRGIAAGQLRLHYQPIINLETGRAVGVEALVRWQHPERGLLEPLEFMDVAERTDVILLLGA